MKDVKKLRTERGVRELEGELKRVRLILDNVVTVAIFATGTLIGLLFHL